QATFLDASSERANATTVRLRRQPGKYSGRLAQVVDLVVLETELDPDTGNPGGQDVRDSAECPAQVRRRHSRAAVDQVEHRGIHVHSVSVTASELLGQPEAGHRYCRAVLRTEFFHAQCDSALEQPGVRESLSPLSLRTGCGPHIDRRIEVRGEAVIGVRSSFP